jgi:hypothetical protein
MTGVGPREPFRQQFLDLSPAAMGGLLQQLLVVAGRQVGRQQSQRGHVHGAARQALEHDREASSETRRLDAVVRRVLREAEHPTAVPEERRPAGRQVQAARVELGQVCHEPRRGAALLARATEDLGRELVVRQVGRDRDRHVAW